MIQCTLKEHLNIGDMVSLIPYHFIRDDGVRFDALYYEPIESEFISEHSNQPYTSEKLKVVSLFSGRHPLLEDSSGYKRVYVFGECTKI